MVFLHWKHFKLTSMYPVGSLIDLIDQQVWNMSFILLSYCYVPFSDYLQLSLHIFIGNWILLFISIFPNTLKFVQIIFQLQLFVFLNALLLKMFMYGYLLNVGYVNKLLNFRMNSKKKLSFVFSYENMYHNKKYYYQIKHLLFVLTSNVHHLKP